MDLFTNEPGPLYVPAFAGRLLLSMAHGIGRAPDAIKRALLDEGVESLWTLAIVVAQWYADNLSAAEATAVTTTLQEFGLTALTSNLNFFRERLLPFVRTAHQAKSDAQLAAAGVYFVAAVEQIGLPMLQSAMKAGTVRLVQQKLLGRLPPSEEVKVAYYRALGVQSKGTPVAPATLPQPSRADRFDRADYSQRRAAPSPSMLLTQRQALRPMQSPPRVALSAATPPRPPMPVLAKEDVTRAYLLTLGWEGTEVDRFLEGPANKRA